jgi:hypothetical protein
MPKWNDCNLIAFGFVMGAVMAGLVISTMAALDGPVFLGNDGRLQWETLVTGLSALMAAWFTVAHLKQQLRQTEDLAERAQRQRVKAVRAILPVALSQLTEYATTCIKTLYALWQYFETDGSLNRSRADLPALKLPPVPDDVLLLLKECVAVMDNDPAAAIVELISHLQIQRTRFTAYMSRLEDHPRDGGNALKRGHIDHGIWDAAEVYARASSLFPFARGEMTFSFALRPDVIRYALASAGIDNEDEREAFADKWAQEFLARKAAETERRKVKTLESPQPA